MRFGLSIPPFTDVTTLVAMARDAEAAGWDGVFLWDHLQWDRISDLDIHDPWVLLGAMATATSRVRLGTMVTPLSRRRPWVVAKHLTTLDHLSGGRAVLGVGLGAPREAEFAAFGDVDDPAGRAALLDDGLAVLDGLLRGGRFSHDGRRSRSTPPSCCPGRCRTPGRRSGSPASRPGPSRWPGRCAGTAWCRSGPTVR
jgi:alkanesulfonate monooxygenase SsuD/methylene tetrahydromethanopterin reductase-like flavin-dependent oxidoreductase (luciferase family)